MRAPSAATLGLFFFVMTSVFLLSYWAPIDVSYDYDDYVSAYMVYANYDLQQFFDSVHFPYSAWGLNGRFEIFFATIFFGLGSIGFSADFSIALMVSFFLALKMSLLVKMGVRDVFVLLSYFLVSLSIFEFNAMRAGIAGVFLLSAVYVFIYKGAKSWCAALFVIACMFHVSSIFYAIFFVVSLALRKVSFLTAALFVFAYATACLFLPLVVEFIPEWLMPYKIREYISLKESFGLYSSHNPFNSYSVFIFVPLFIAPFACKKVYGNVDFYTVYLMSVFACVTYSFTPSMSVVAERVWLLGMPLLFVMITWVVNVSSNEIRNIYPGKIFYMLLFCSSAYNFTVSHPQANLFYFVGYEAGVYAD